MAKIYSSANAFFLNRASVLSLGGHALSSELDPSVPFYRIYPLYFTSVIR